MPAPTRSQQVRAHQQAAAGIRAKIQRFADLHWQALPSYRSDDIDRLVAKVVPAVESGQRQVATLTDVYLARLAGRAGIGTTNVADLRGVDNSIVYRRPAVTVYTALANGATFTDAVEQGRNRLASLVSTDMLMAMREQASTSMQAQGFRTYQRVLSGAENCALCEIASTQVYYAEDLLPIHPGCDCGVEPLDDPTQLDAGSVQLEQTHSDVADFAGSADRTGRHIDYRKITVRRHGEYGPTLSWRKDAFTGPSDL